MPTLVVGMFDGAGAPLSKRPEAAHASTPQWRRISSAVARYPT